ncbi:MAG: hypothetical protein KDA27_22615 [Candidatus Eisenbacteria bacterium]|uniref:Cbb3-type cytochrome c oxidase subunit 3 n=1 Tax=Eiseniibacteriota bacterium TaxID=2212470 RepID=A0A956NGX5_UNCEI|nr:hypothetical protein [Candidatus Eisenbacteria bacterium]MCB9464712.1 hypothetical protein [Candidatus Eisenbacteria bacterium]
MFQDFFARSELLILPLVSLGIFFVTFMLVLTHVVFGLRKKELLTHVSMLPLDDEDEAHFRVEGEEAAS